MKCIIREFVKENDAWPPRRRLAHINRVAKNLPANGFGLINRCPLPGTRFEFRAPGGVIGLLVTGFPYYGKPLGINHEVWLVPVESVGSSYTHAYYVSDLVRNYENRIQD